MRWIKQRDKSICVPVAFINILKWAGYNALYSDLSYWKEVLHCTKDGCHIRFYSKMLHTLPGVKIARKTRPSLEELDVALNNNMAVLFRSAWLDQDKCKHAHLFLITRSKNRKFFLVNVHGGHLWLCWHTFVERYMEEHRNKDGIYPTAWFIQKRE